MLNLVINELTAVRYVMPNLSDEDDVLCAPVKELEWDNSDNNAIYETIKAQGLYKLAKKGGLSTGCDMEYLTPYWSVAKSVLEVGAGYGRVIDYLLKHPFQGAITAVERCNALFEHLEKQYTTYKNIQLLHADIRYLRNVNERFDLILMLWSGIADFSPKEQRLIFAKLAKLLNEKGKLIIDTLPASTIPLDMRQSGAKKVYKQEINGVTVYTYSMSLKEIDNYAQLAGFTSIEHKTYYTLTGRERLLHILS